MPKITLSATEETVRTAHALAKAHGTSVSAMFARFMHEVALQKQGHCTSAKVPPNLRRVSGMVRLPEGMSDEELLMDTLTKRETANG